MNSNCESLSVSACKANCISKYVRIFANDPVDLCEDNATFAERIHVTLALHKLPEKRSEWAKFLVII
jgi:hypothetical protein